jgi:excisionase family DNA binding protein
MGGAAVARGHWFSSHGVRTVEKSDDVLTTGEAAALCGISRSTLRRAAHSGLVTSWHTPGGHLRFTRAVCIEFSRSLGQVEVVGRADWPVRVSSSPTALKERQPGGSLAEELARATLPRT